MYLNYILTDKYTNQEDSGHHMPVSVASRSRIYKSKSKPSRSVLLLGSGYIENICILLTAGHFSLGYSEIVHNS